MKRIIIIGIVLILLNVLLIFSPFNNMIQIFFYNVSVTTSNIGDDIENFFEVFESKKDLINQNEALKNENKNLKTENKKKSLENETLKSKNENLSNTLGVKKSTNYATLMADVLFENTNTNLNVLTINKGTKDGVKTNQLVTYDGNLIGYINKVEKEKSEVILLNNTNIKFNIPISINTEKGKKKAIIEEYNSNGYLILSTLENDNNIQKGDSVYTNGFGTNQRENIYLGDISKIIKPGEQGEKYAINLSLKNMEYVEVVTYES